MAFKVEHVHVKSADPNGVARFYRDTLGATVETGDEKEGRWRLELDGLKINITGNVPYQERKQLLGLEHIALETTEFDKDIVRLTKAGAKVLLVQDSRVKQGMRTGFVESPDGQHQLEIVEVARV